LTCKKGCEEHFDADRVRERVTHYGLLLPFPIRVTAGKRIDVVNADGAPWRQEFKNEKQRTKALLEFGEQAFGVRFFDAIPLKSRVGGVDGVAFVLPYTPNLATKQTHRVYLKNMLLSEKTDNLLPDWAFFVKAVVNANDLRPTASRESFYEDEKLEAARVALGECLREYLVDLAERAKKEREQPSDPPRRDAGKLDALIGLHDLAIKFLALQDDDFYRLFIHWLPFETSKGLVTLGEYRDHNDVIRFVPDVDQFRQLSQVAAAQELWVINGGFVHGAELLAKYADVFDGVSVEAVDPQTLSQSFDDLTSDEQDRAQEFLNIAEAALEPHLCGADIKKFLPNDLPALYSTDLEAKYLRQWERSKEIATPLWSGVLDNIQRRARNQGPAAQLVFNLNNALVRRLAALRDRAVVKRAVQMLYVQSLLLGHHPLKAKEMGLLNGGLSEMIEWGIELRERGGSDSPSREFSP
jgi:molecular chaperone HtpG